MSFVPAPQKATTAGGANINQNGATSVVTNVQSAAEAADTSGEDAFITSRTFDLYWVDKTALMYKDGYVKVSGRLFHSRKWLSSRATANDGGRQIFLQ